MEPGTCRRSATTQCDVVRATWLTSMRTRAVAGVDVVYPALQTCTWDRWDAYYQASGGCTKPPGRNCARQP